MHTMKWKQRIIMLRVTSYFVAPINKINMIIKLPTWKKHKKDNLFKDNNSIIQWTITLFVCLFWKISTYIYTKFIKMTPNNIHNAKKNILNDYEEQQCHIWTWHPGNELNCDINEYWWDVIKVLLDLYVYNGEFKDKKCSISTCMLRIYKP